MADLEESTNWSYYIYSIAICIILIIIGFFFFFFMPSSTVYYERKAADWTDLYGELLAEVINTPLDDQAIICIYGHHINRSKVDSQTTECAKHAKHAKHDKHDEHAEHDKHNEQKKSGKKVTFTPAVVEPYVTDKYFKLYEQIRAIPLVHYAGLINLKSDFTEKTTYGYAPVANNTLRYFYPFKVSATRKCGITVDGQRKFFNEGVWVCADVSREHSLFNQSLYENSIILFIDISRENAPLGISDNYDISSDSILAAF